MFLAQASFGKAVSDLDAEGVGDKVDSYLALLQKNGQICGDALHAISDGDMVAYAYLVRPDSILREHHSRYGLRELDSLCDSLGRGPSWNLLVDTVPLVFPDLLESSALCLFSSAYDGQSPVCDLDTGDRFPSYLIPIDDDERERLFFWSREYNRLDGIWFSSGDLEIPAYRQLASPNSGLAQQGRELASLVETALNKPVYYFLMRYYGRGKNEPQRTCPGCGDDWRCKTDPGRSTGIWNFPFRCDKCRLVSQLADADYDDSHASIGEFEPPSPSDTQSDTAGGSS